MVILCEPGATDFIRVKWIKAMVTAADAAAGAGDDGDLVGQGHGGFPPCVFRRYRTDGRVGLWRGGVG